MTDTEFNFLNGRLVVLENELRKTRNALSSLANQKKVSDLKTEHVSLAEMLDALTGAQRRLLKALANSEDDVRKGVKQEEFERRLGVSNMELRSRLGALSKSCRKAKVPYPILTTGKTRDERIFRISLQLFHMLNHQ